MCGVGANFAKVFNALHRKSEKLIFIFRTLLGLLRRPSALFAEVFHNLNILLFKNNKIFKL